MNRFKLCIKSYVRAVHTPEERLKISIQFFDEAIPGQAKKEGEGEEKMVRPGIEPGPLPLRRNGSEFLQEGVS